jgi:UDP-N-acetylglucosamine 2-epimerase
MPKIVTIIGARPQFIKAAGVSRAITEYNAHLLSAALPSAYNHSPLAEVLVHTGQHYDANMSDVFFQELGIPQPNYFLRVGSGGHGEQTGKMLIKIEKVLIREHPDMVLVYGDTNSTLAGALAAAKLHIPVAHVEAGLRCYNKAMPEEINRALTDQVSSILFCPSKIAVNNLRKEGFANIISNGELIDARVKGKELLLKGTLSHDSGCPPSTNHYQLVVNVGDIMFDLALQIKEKFGESEVLNKYNLTRKEFILVTIHRAENTDNSNNLRNIWDALIDLAKSGKTIFFPAHPRTMKALVAHGLLDCQTSDRIILNPPIPYGEMTVLEGAARLTITDSGGVQKESYYFKTPCIIPRNESEWVELAESGWAHLAGAHRLAVVESATHLWGLERNPDWVTFYGDGKAADRVCKILTLLIPPSQGNE